MGPRTFGPVGEWTIRFLSGKSVDVAFMAPDVSPHRGLTDSALADATIEPGSMSTAPRTSCWEIVAWLGTLSLVDVASLDTVVLVVVDGEVVDRAIEISTARDAGAARMSWLVGTGAFENPTPWRRGELHERPDLLPPAVKLGNSRSAVPPASTKEWS